MKKKFIIFFIISFIYIVFFPILKEKVLDKDYYFTLETEGLKNDKSLGTEIWLDHIEVDGKEYDMSKIVRPEGFEYNGRLYCTGEVPASLTTVIKYKHSIKFVFIKHPYSGIVIFTGFGQKCSIDLYSDEQETFSYSYER